MAERLNVQILVIVVLVVLTGMVSRPLGAEMVWRFDPSLEISLAHDGNVFSSTSEEELSDQLAILRPVLPLIGESERTVLTLLYAPEAAFYSTYSDLNRLDHRAEVGLTRSFSQRSNWEVGGAWLDTSDPHSELLEDDIVVARSDRQMLTANTGFTVGVSSRVDLSFRYDFRDLEYDDPDIAGYTSQLAGATAGFITGARSDIDLDYAYQYSRYPGRGVDGIHNLLARYTVRPSEPTTLTLAGGVFFQDYRSEETGGEDPVDENDSGFIGSIEWSRQGWRIGFNAGLSREVRPGGGIGQSVLSHALRLSVSSEIGRRASMNLSANLQRNEPLLDDQNGDLDLLRSSLDIDYDLNRYLGLRFFVDYIYQQWEVEIRRDLSYPRIGLSLIIHTRRDRS